MNRLPPWLGPVLLIVLAVLAGNAMYLTGQTINDPISWTAGISHQLCHVTCGRPAIDPNVGFITQPMGHLAAYDLLHGHLPLWNYYEGLGAPLAGEMQSAALFPLTLLFAFPAGLLWFHLILELIAGVSTYFLLRRLGLPSVAGVIGGSLFALNGTYAWIGNSALNPVAFLPLLLLGLEVIYDAVRDRRAHGWYLMALALALSFYAGFPETAYLDGLLALGWAVVRLFSLERSRRLVAAVRVGIGGIVGGLLSLPIMVPFMDYLKQANVGGHVATVDGTAHIAGSAYPMLLDPYVYSTIFSNSAVTNAWGGIGGYFGASVAVLGLVGLLGSRLRSLRIYLAAWVLLGMGLLDNFLNVRRAWNLLPQMGTIAVPRYIFPSLEMALVILAALGVSDLVAGSRRVRWNLPGAGLVVLAMTLLGVATAAKYNDGFVVAGKKRTILIGLHALPFIAIGLLVALGVLLALTRWRGTIWLIALVAVGEAVLYFFTPTAEAPKQITLDEAPIAFLKAHQGYERFLDFAVLYPNWGSQYGLYEVNQVDLPFPHAYADFLASTLYPGLYPSNQFTVHAGMAGIINQEQDLVTHFSAFEQASVKYLLFPHQVPLMPALAKLGVTPVFRDSLAAIYQMPTTRHFISASNPSCIESTVSVNHASVVCPSGPTSLLRTELMMPGWRAYVNGREVPITTVDGVYQSISLPAGTSSVRYSFRPPHETFALAGGLLGILLMIAAWLFSRYRRPRGAHAAIAGVRPEAVLGAAASPSSYSADSSDSSSPSP